MTAKKATAKQEIRTFEGGATRDADHDKLDFEGFNSPIVEQEYAEYMHRHRRQSDGKMRPSDNWQNGIPIAQYMKSLKRHVHDLHMMHRGFDVHDRDDGHIITESETCCGIIFNAKGFLFETLKEEGLACHLPTKKQ